MTCPSFPLDLVLVSGLVNVVLALFVWIQGYQLRSLRSLVRYLRGLQG